VTIIIPANSAVTAAYDVDNSCRFNDGDSANFTKTQSGGNQDTWTFSAWIKRSTFRMVEHVGNARQSIFSTRHPTSTSENCNLSFEASDELFLTVNDGSGIVGRLGTNRKFTDCGAWYHIMAIWDSGNATAGNRMRMFVNGVEETSFKTDTNPSQDADSYINEANNVLRIGIGGDGGTSAYPFDGYMAEVCLIDGTVYTASDFGEFDEDSPTIWKPKDVSGLTFGTNGFYLDFEASGNLGNDANGGTDFAENNIVAADQAQDSPTNNFCTMNPLDNYWQGSTYSQGNLTVETAGGGSSFIHSATIPVSNGKWYWEVKMDDDDQKSVGVIDYLQPDSSEAMSLGCCYRDIDGKSHSIANPARQDYGDTYGDGDIIGHYLDLDNNKMYFAKNGTIQASGAGLPLTAAASTKHGWYTPSCCKEDGGSTFFFNFGNGDFDGTAVSSSNADANGYGLFEYSPNDGGSSSFDSAAKDFLAICTKNLAEYGG